MSSRRNGSDAAIRSIHPRGLYRIWRKGRRIDILDVRRASSFAEGHVPGARWTDLERLDPRAIVTDRRSDPDEPIYIICEIGVRSLEAARIFAKAGFPGVVDVRGGTRAWREAGLPLVQESWPALPLRRQVQLAAGFLALTGSVLAVVASPLFLAVPAGVGAGLMYTAATDQCALGRALAKMPWNRRPATVSTTQKLRVAAPSWTTSSIAGAPAIATPSRRSSSP
jgi:rhodanese-related sulfurtransferase